MSFDAKGFGQRVRTLRKEAGLTQENLSAGLNMSVVHLAHIEIGKNVPSIDLVIHIAEFFHVSLDYLMLGKTSCPEDYKPALREAIRILSKLESD